MKKIFIFLITILLLTGCNKNKEININTVINKDGYFSSIQYPTFNINTLDKQIQKDINKIEKTFKEKRTENSELNIDFKYEIINEHYISAIIISTIVHNNKKNININTYLFDKQNNKFISLDSLINNKKTLIKNIKKEFKSKYGSNLTGNIKIKRFFISKDYLNYYIVKNKVYLVQIPVDQIDFKFDILFDKIEKKEPIIQEKNTIDIYQPLVALTFDDGPSKYTNEILNILKENNTCATFFVLGNKVSHYQDIVIKTLENGNEIGNHTYNHKWLSHLDEIKIKEQISKTQEIIFENVRFLPTLFRPSYGDVPKKIRSEIDLEVILWNVDTLDWKLKNKNQIVKRATNNVKDGDIILMHDTYKRTKDALPEIISILKEKGFQFVTVSELEEIKKLRKYNE